jgi:hypothetical protein
LAAAVAALILAAVALHADAARHASPGHVSVVPLPKMGNPDLVDIEIFVPEGSLI